MTNKFLSIVFSLFVSCAFGSASADENADCPDGLRAVGDLQVQVLNSEKYGCRVQVRKKTFDGTGRVYTFSNNGKILIYNDYDTTAKTKNSTGTGARTYYVFPRRQLPTAEEISPGELEVVTSAGDHVRFKSGAAPLIENTSQYAVRLVEDPSINSRNKGGVEIVQNQYSKTLVLDSGFAIGDVMARKHGGFPFIQPGHKSTFKDSVGNQCTLENSSLFQGVGYSAEFKFQSDEALFAYLKKACPKLVLPSLSAPKTSGEDAIQIFVMDNNLSGSGK